MKITGNLDTKEGKTSYPIIQSMIPWTEKIYDMTDDEINEYKSAYREEYHSDESKKNNNREVVDIFYMEYQYHQLRKSYEWVQEQFKLSGDKMAIRREILLQRLRGSNNSPVSPEDIEFLISNMTKSSKDLIINNKWRFLLYEHGVVQIPGLPHKDLDPNIPYIVGIDPASGGGGDYTAITILNPNNLRIAAEFRNPYISGTDLCKLLVTLVNEYIPKGVIIPEKNSMGIYLIQMICNQTSIKPNLYWSNSVHQIERMTEESPDDFKLRLQAEQYKKYGTYLTKRVRDAMLELLFKHINECKQILNTEYLVDDICKLARTSTGRIEAVVGEHDDSLFSYLHAIYLYYTGDNLLTFGINRSMHHPVTGLVEDDIESKYYDDDDYQTINSNFFSTKNVSYEDIAIQDAIEQEEMTKYLMDKFSFVEDPAYKEIRKNGGLHNETNIPPSFFTIVNNIEGEYSYE